MWCLLQDLEMWELCALGEDGSDALISEFKAVFHQGAIEAQRADVNPVITSVSFKQKGGEC